MPIEQSGRRFDVSRRLGSIVTNCWAIPGKVGAAALAVAVIFTFPVGPLHAQDTARESTRADLLRRATAARAVANWAETVRLLRQAISIRPSDPVRLGLAGALLELGRHQEAAAEAARCIQSSHRIRPNASDGSSVFDACSQILRDTGSHVAELNLQISPAEWGQVRLTVDGEPVSVFVRDRPIYLTPGPRRLVVRAVSPYDFSREAYSERSLSLRAGSRQTISIELGPLRDPSSEQRVAPQHQRSTFFTITPLLFGGLGLALGAVGFGYQYSADATRDEYSMVCSAGCTVGTPQFNSYYRNLPAEAAQLEETGRALIWAGGISLAVSAAIFTVGYLIRPRTSGRLVRAGETVNHVVF